MATVEDFPIPNAYRLSVGVTLAAGNTYTLGTTGPAASFLLTDTDPGPFVQFGVSDPDDVVTLNGVDYTFVQGRGAYRIEFADGTRFTVINVFNIDGAGWIIPIVETVLPQVGASNPAYLYDPGQTIPPAYWGQSFVVISTRPVNEFRVPCFTRGTQILTDQGCAPIEALAVGDLVMTRDCGPQPIRWIGSRRLDAAELAQCPHLRAIRLDRGVLGDGRPDRPLTVSPQHRVLVRSPIAERMFGAEEVLVAAKHLLALDGVEVVTECDGVEYFHFMFDEHQVVFSNGAETESLYAGPMALGSVSSTALDEIYAILPALRERCPDRMPASARMLIPGRKGRKLVERHIKSRKPLYA